MLLNKSEEPRIIKASIGEAVTIAVAASGALYETLKGKVSLNTSSVSSVKAQTKVFGVKQATAQAVQAKGIGGSAMARAAKGELEGILAGRKAARAIDAAGSAASRAGRGLALANTALTIATGAATALALAALTKQVIDNRNRQVKFENEQKNLNSEYSFRIGNAEVIAKRADELAQENKGRLNIQEQQISDVKGEIKKTNTRLDSQNKEIEVIRSQIKRLNQDAVLVNQKIQQSQAELRSNISQAEAKLNSNIAQAQSNLNQQIQKIENQVASVNKQVEEIKTAKTNNNDLKFKDIDNKLKKLENVNEQQVNRLENKIDKADSKIDNLPSLQDITLAVAGLDILRQIKNRADLTEADKLETEEPE